MYGATGSRPLQLLIKICEAVQVDAPVMFHACPHWRRAQTCLCL